MRIEGMLAVCALAGCAAAVAPSGEDHEAAMAACVAAVSAHVGKGADAVVARWAGDTATGGGIVAVTDAQTAGTERRHDCEVTADGRVVALRHAGA